MITKDKNDNLILSHAPEKAYQDSQLVTEQLTRQAEKLGKAEAENKALKEKLEKDSKKITVTLKDVDSKNIQLHNLLYGGRLYNSNDLNVQSIKINNVDEADKFLTKVLESEISQERDELQKKFEGVELKLDEKDSEIRKQKREITRIKELHHNTTDDMTIAFDRELNKIRKTAKSKVETQLASKDVDHAKLENRIEFERQEANLREVELLGKLDSFRQANDVLEAKVIEVKTESPKLLGVLGNYINKMMNYKKAVKALDNFKIRSRRGIIVAAPFGMNLDW